MPGYYKHSAPLEPAGMEGGTLEEDARSRGASVKYPSDRRSANGRAHPYRRGAKVIHILRAFSVRGISRLEGRDTLTAPLHAVAFRTPDLPDTQHSALRTPNLSEAPHSALALTGPAGWTARHTEGPARTKTIVVDPKAP